jgi:transcriptional regulator GlxA family with amidase domain
MSLTSVAVILQEPLAPFEIGVLHEVFGVDRTSDGVPEFRFTVCAERPRAPLASGPVTVSTEHGLEVCEQADLIAVPGGPMPTGASEAVLTQLRAAAGRGATVLGMCSGAFTLGEAGVLDGLTAATHWRYAGAFRETFPGVEVDRDSLYRFEGEIITSAGTAAGIDACLQLVRREHGPAVANRIARRMVVPPHRDGGQRQYIDAPVPEADSAATLKLLLVWMEEHLSHQHSVDSLAAQANLSSRTLSRRFQSEVGASPMNWLTHQRVFRAQELLEGTDMSIDQVAGAVGFGTDTALRHHFRQQVGIAPSAYRAKFRTPSPRGSRTRRQTLRPEP